MLELFKETKVAFFISGVSGGVALALNGVFFDRPLLQAALGALVWIFFSAAVFGIVAYIKNNKVNRLLHDCDVVNFLAINERFSKIKRPGKAVKAMVQLNLSTAYLNIGNDAAAVQVLYGVDLGRFPKGATGASFELVYHSNYFIYFLNAGDLTKAAYAIEQMQSILQNRKLPGAFKKFAPDLCRHQQHLLNMANGNYEGAELAFSLVYEKSEHKINRVAAKYALGKVYLHQGRIADAERAFEYAVEHGGSSVHRARAVEQLEALGKHVVCPPPETPHVQIFSTVERAVMILYCGLVVFAAVGLLAMSFLL